MDAFHSTVGECEGECWTVENTRVVVDGRRQEDSVANRLAGATSPYLLQHADNPVHWWEWGPEAFAEARERNVPVLLSVGYAACHWCHEVPAWRLSADFDETAVQSGYGGSPRFI
jgi:hypothetical protein